MTTKAQSVAVRFLPSLTDVAFIVPLIFQFNQLGGASSLLADGDTGWHLRTGEWILANGRVPQQDMFSYTHAGQPWYAWEWLWDVCFGFLNTHFGLQAVIVAFHAVALLHFSTVIPPGAAQVPQSVDCDCRNGVWPMPARRFTGWPGHTFSRCFLSSFFWEFWIGLTWKESEQRRETEVSDR